MLINRFSHNSSDPAILDSSNPANTSPLYQYLDVVTPEQGRMLIIMRRKIDYLYREDEGVSIWEVGEFRPYRQLWKNMLDNLFKADEILDVWENGEESDRRYLRDIYYARFLGTKQPKESLFEAVAKANKAFGIPQSAIARIADKPEGAFEVFKRNRQNIPVR